METRVRAKTFCIIASILGVFAAMSAVLGNLLAPYTTTWYAIVIGGIVAGLAVPVLSYYYLFFGSPGSTAEKE